MTSQSLNAAYTSLGSVKRGDESLIDKLKSPRFLKRVSFSQPEKELSHGSLDTIVVDHKSMKERLSGMMTAPDFRVGRVVAAPGSGKTTRAPMYVAELFPDGRVFVVEPDAWTVANALRIVKLEMGQPATIMTEGAIADPNARIVYLTAREMLCSYVEDPEMLVSASAVIVDESHHGSHEMAAVRALVATRVKHVPRLYMTATTHDHDTRGMQRLHDILSVAFPFLEPEKWPEADDSSMPYHPDRINNRTMVFLPTSEDFPVLRQYYENNGKLVYELPESASAHDFAEVQRELKSVGRQAFVLLVTQACQTGITLPIDTVIDSGLKCFTLVNPAQREIGRNTAVTDAFDRQQRAGRCGREGRGTYFFAEVELSRSFDVTPGEEYGLTVWLLLLGIKPIRSDAEWMRQLGTFTAQKLCNFVNSTVHPFIIRHYLDKEGGLYRNFKVGLAPHWVGTYRPYLSGLTLSPQSRIDWFGIKHQETGRHLIIPLQPKYYYFKFMLDVALLEDADDTDPLMKTELKFDALKELPEAPAPTQQLTPPPRGRRKSKSVSPVAGRQRSATIQNTVPLPQRAVSPLTRTLSQASAVSSARRSESLEGSLVSESSAIIDDLLSVHENEENDEDPRAALVTVTPRRLADRARARELQALTQTQDEVFEDHPSGLRLMRVAPLSVSHIKADRKAIDQVVGAPSTSMQALQAQSSTSFGIEQGVMGHEIRNSLDGTSEFLNPINTMGRIHIDLTAQQSANLATGRILYQKLLSNKAQIYQMKSGDIELAYHAAKRRWGENFAERVKIDHDLEVVSNKIRLAMNMLRLGYLEMQKARLEAKRAELEIERISLHRMQQLFSLYGYSLSNEARVAAPSADAVHAYLKK